ncbi:lysozyme [Actinokineospora pegani]|uniref:lysozyme n=1 Tax=Actinokineospora pegani TaxID=2654637 RepID=UPI0012E9B05A|nr:lysozyme [Actinokineospora pegani]
MSTNVTTPGTRRTRRTIGAAVAATAAAIGLTAFVPAAVAGQDEADATMNHTMGSQIREHEDVDPAGATSRSAEQIGVAATVAGIDVASYQGNVDWAGHWAAGKRFAFVKATEGTGYKNPYFTQQYNGSYGVGMIRGTYHFALPDRSSGATQANYFVNNGGGWSGDGKTLPGVADLEYNPYGATCYGLSQASMAAWIRDFSNTYRSRTGRDPIFYTSTSWWSQCVGTAQQFANTNPLWVARYSSSVGALPYNWGVWTFWQHTSTPLDQNYFNGAIDRLRVLATG